MLGLLMLSGCGSESPSRVAFRKVDLGDPRNIPQLMTFKQECASELVWLAVRDGKIISKVWARASLSGIGQKVSADRDGLANVPFAVLEQEPWLVTYRFEACGVSGAYEPASLHARPSEVLSCLFPRTSFVLTGRGVGDADIRSIPGDSGSQVFIIEDGASRLWLDMHEFEGGTHIRGYLAAFWPTVRPSRYPVLADPFADSISPLADLAGWCWYQARSPAHHSPKRLFGDYRRFRGAMNIDAAAFDMSRTREERDSGTMRPYRPVFDHGHLRFYSGFPVAE